MKSPGSFLIGRAPVTGRIELRLLALEFFPTPPLLPPLLMDRTVPWLAPLVPDFAPLLDPILAFLGPPPDVPAAPLPVTGGREAGRLATPLGLTVPALAGRLVESALPDPTFSFSPERCASLLHELTESFSHDETGLACWPDLGVSLLG